jgi:hypothetical protein
VPKKVQFTQERVEYNVFLFDDPLKGSKSLKIFKISLTFPFDKLSHLSKSVHIGENSQILTVSNKKIVFFINNGCRQIFIMNMKIVLLQRKTLLDTHCGKDASYGTKTFVFILCGNYLWNKFNNYKTNDICRKR